MKSQNKKSVFESILWNYSGKIGKQIWGLLVGIILARKLGPNIFGAISICLAIISIFSFFISSGMFSAIIQSKSPSNKHFNTVFIFNLIVSIILICIIYLSSSWINQFLEINYDIAVVLVSLSSILLISALTQVQEAIKIREMRFDIIAKASLISSFFSGSLGLILVLNDYGIWSLVVLHISEKLIFSFLIWINAVWIPKLEFHYSEFKELWKYGSNLFYAGFLENLILNLDSIIISKSISLTQLGFYNRAKTFNNFVVRYATTSVEGVLFSKMSTLQDDFNKIIRYNNRVDNLISFLTFFLLGLLYICSEPIIILMLGEEWRPTVDIFKILCFSGFSYPIGKITLLILKSHGNSKSIFNLELIKNFIYLMIIIIGFSFSFKVFLYLLIVNGLISVLLNIYASKKYFSINFFKRTITIFQYSIISIFVCFIIILVNINIENMYLELLVYSLLYSILYLLLNFIIKTYSIKILTIFFKKSFKNIFN